MAGEKTARELIYETNRDVKWICRVLERMEARDECFEGRLRVFECLSGFEPYMRLWHNTAISMTSRPCRPVKIEHLLARWCSPGGASPISSGAAGILNVLAVVVGVGWAPCR